MMKEVKVQIIVILMLVFGLTKTQAQQIHETVSASGGNASGTNGSVSYTVGQVFYNTISNGNGSVAQGVQQAFEINVVTSITELANNFSVYPNPTADFLILKNTLQDFNSLAYQVFDANGKLLELNKINNSETKIAMKQYVSGSYFIKITDEKNAIKTYQIIKN